jgi:hypothetical protein
MTDDPKRVTIKYLFIKLLKKKKRGRSRLMTATPSALKISSPIVSSFWLAYVFWEPSAFS